jgi:hypothetical protein
MFSFSFVSVLFFSLNSPLFSGVGDLPSSVGGAQRPIQRSGGLWQRARRLLPRERETGARNPQELAGGYIL